MVSFIAFKIGVVLRNQIGHISIINFWSIRLIILFIIRRSFVLFRQFYGCFTMHLDFNQHQTCLWLKSLIGCHFLFLWDCFTLIFNYLNPIYFTYAIIHFIFFLRNGIDIITIIVCPSVCILHPLCVIGYAFWWLINRCLWYKTYVINYGKDNTARTWRIDFNLCFNWHRLRHRLWWLSYAIYGFCYDHNGELSIIIHICR